MTFFQKGCLWIHCHHTVWFLPSSWIASREEGRTSASSSGILLWKSYANYWSCEFVLSIQMLSLYVDMKGLGGEIQCRLITWCLTLFHVSNSSLWPITHNHFSRLCFQEKCAFFSRWWILEYLHAKCHAFCSIFTFLSEHSNLMLMM